MRVTVAVTAALVLYLASVVSGSGKPGDFDYYVFVRQWGATFCEDVSCSRKPLCDFTIHGLWPNYFHGYPFDCTSEELDERKIESLIPEMEKEWPSYTTSNLEFWGHEWSKHGTCTGNSQHTYFDDVLRLDDKYDLMDAFSRHGIDAPSKSSYHIDELYGSLQDEFGRRPLLHWDGNCDLSEVWLCLDKDLCLIDCPSAAVPKPTTEKFWAKGVQQLKAVTPNCAKISIPAERCSSRG